MSLLKTYEIAAVKISLLNGQICPLITNYQGSSFYDGVLSVYGDSITDENALDAAVAAHNPNAVEVPESITPRQIRQALILSGVNLTDIDNALSTLPEPQQSLAKAEWLYATSFDRHRPLVVSVGQMLGWTNEQLDALWAYGSTL